MDAIKRFENWAAPFLIVVFLGLMIWMVIQAGGLGPVVEQAGTLGWGPDFWAVFPISLMGMIAFWSTLSLNMPDFTRFGRSQREQMVGQALGLPTTMTLFPLVGVLTIVGDRHRLRRGDLGSRSRWSRQLDNPLVVVLMLFTLALATLSTNVAANVVSPSYDFSNAWPQQDQLPHRRHHHGHHRHPDHALEPAGRPRASTSSPGSARTAALTGAIAGVLIADYWLIRRSEAQARRPVPAERHLPLRRRLELAGARRARRRAPSSPSAAPTRRPAARTVPGRRDHPVPQAVLRLQLDRRA